MRCFRYVELSESTEHDFKATGLRGGGGGGGGKGGQGHGKAHLERSEGIGFFRSQ